MPCARAWHRTWASQRRGGGGAHRHGGGQVQQPTGFHRAIAQPSAPRSPAACHRRPWGRRYRPRSGVRPQRRGRDPRPSRLTARSLRSLLMVSRASVIHCPPLLLLGLSACPPSTSSKVIPCIFREDCEQESDHRPGALSVSVREQRPASSFLPERRVKRRGRPSAVTIAWAVVSEALSARQGLGDDLNRGILRGYGTPAPTTREST
jgi:hypothetical protein